VFSRFPIKIQLGNPEWRAREASQVAFCRATVTASKEFILRPQAEKSAEFESKVNQIAARVGREDDLEQLQLTFVEETKAFAELQRQEVDEVITGMADSMEEMIGGISASIVTSGQRVEELNMIRALIDQAETARTLEETRTLLNSGMTALQKLVEHEIRTQRELWSSHDSYSNLLRSKLEHLEKKNRIDPLTGVANRAGIERHVKLVLDHCRTNKKAYSFALLDLDGFKEVNDRHGHQAGDAALISFAQRLSAVLGSQTFVGRLGGDEFVVVSASETAMLALLLHRLNENLVERPIVHANRALKIGASFGIQPILPITTFDDLHRLADSAMYAAKQSRRAA
jgi:diguanylate cyclase (GGDEF)-like protein